MRIYTEIIIDIDSLETIEEEFFEYEGPLALCWGDDGDDSGTAVGEDGDATGPGSIGGLGDSGSSLGDDPMAYGSWGGIFGEFSTGMARGLPGDDPMALGGGWLGFGYNNITNEDVTGRIDTVLALAAVLFGPQIAPLAMGWSVFNGMISISNYMSSVLPSSTVSWGNAPESENDNGLPEAIEKTILSLINRTKTSQEQLNQAIQTIKVQPSQFIQPRIEYSKYVQPDTSNIDQITNTYEPYNINNFPIPWMVDMYSEPKTSMWYK